MTDRRATLFNRQVRLSVGPRTGGEFRAWLGLRVNFEVIKTDNASPDVAKIQVWNMNRDSAGYIQSGSDLAVQLSAGYQEDPIPRVFKGGIQPRSVKLVDDGVDRIVQMEARDGRTFWRDSRVSQSFGGPITTSTLLRQLADIGGLAYANIPADLVDIEYQGGYAMAGPIRGYLDDLTSSVGARWMIQDDELVVVLEDHATTEEVYVLRPASGLVGTPERMDSRKIKVTSLLNGRIKPRRAIKVESETVNGLYVPTLVTHRGDSGYESTYYTEVEAREIG